jgi:threonine dehydrogenase-like Zn-dependent dehydrogenase
LKAIALTPGKKGLRIVERPEPAISSDREIKLKVVRVGVCGTDREEAAGGRALAPDGRDELVIGHEMLGRVVEAGDAVRRVRPGDLAVFTVRRGCGRCLSCGLNRPDMCTTGDYRERGIWGLDGYQCAFVLDHEDNVVRVPAELESVGVLVEPLSVVEKAIEEAVRLQLCRRPDGLATPDWLHGRRCLVAGLGPIGLLASAALRLRGAEVYGLDIVDEGSARPLWLERIDGRYVDGRKVASDRIDDAVGPMDLILEATGIPSLAFDLLDALGEGGVYVLTGIPGGTRPSQIPAAALIRKLVLFNQVMVGSVNASRDHFQMAVDDLAQARLLWSGHVETLITRRHRLEELEQALGPEGEQDIKVVVEWEES